MTDADELLRLFAERERLLQEKSDNSETILQIKVQLDAQRAKRADGTWQERDPTWQPRAVAALRHHGWADQQLAREISEVNRKIRAYNYMTQTVKRSQTFERVFMHVARELLSDALYAMVLQEAQIRVQAELLAAREP